MIKRKHIKNIQAILLDLLQNEGQRVSKREVQTLVQNFNQMLKEGVGSGAGRGGGKKVGFKENEVL